VAELRIQEWRGVQAGAGRGSPCDPGGRAVESQIICAGSRVLVTVGSIEQGYYS
jgi:hypothetical protein